MYTKFNSDPGFELQRRSSRFFLGRPKTKNCCNAKTIFAPLQRKELGIKDVCSALKRCLHLRKDVDAKYPNATQRDQLEGLIVVDQGVINVNHREQVCIFFDTMTSLTNAFIVANYMQRL